MKRKKVVKIAFRIEVTDECIGCGVCATTCDNFEMVEGDKRKAKPKEANVKDIGCNKDAADSCPVQAIKIAEE
jgi:ferredoxin